MRQLFGKKTDEIIEELNEELVSIVCVSLPQGSPVFSRHPETEITSVTKPVPAGAAICFEGIKVSMLTVTTFGCGTLMVSGTLNLCLTGCSFVNSSALI